MRAWLWSRQGSRRARPGGRSRPDQNASVRSDGDSSGVPAPSGSSSPRAPATRPSTAKRWPMTPATVALRRTGRSSSYHLSRTGACHSDSPMSRSSASSRAVSASYGVTQPGIGMRAGRRPRQFSRTRERSSGSRSRSRSRWSRATASRSRSASSAHGPHSVRCASTAAVSPAEHAESAQAPSRDLSTPWLRTGTSGSSTGSSGSLSSGVLPVRSAWSSADRRGPGMRGTRATPSAPSSAGVTASVRGRAGRSLRTAGCAPWRAAGGRAGAAGAPRPR